MKKFLSCFLSVALAAIMSVSFAGCFGGDDYDDPYADDTPKEYVIQYTDDSGVHKITVSPDMPYSLEVVPEKNGYEFLGLFDAEVGGTQYVSASGASLSPFTDNKNMVLFPQFKAKDYTVILDYQNAPVTGARQLTVAYGESLPELPKNLTLANKEFSGWYTKANCEGVQVADKYGLIPLVSVLNSENFDLSGKSVTLFAGFEAQKVTVTCCFESGMDTEEVEVEYGTPVKNVVPNTRVDGKAPLVWSKTQGGEPFNGVIDGDTVLYALEYAPVIDFDTDGGSKVVSIVARAGSTVSLPTPVKDLAKFAYWENMQGNKYTSTTMPEKSISLKAVWQAKIVFDSNGGSSVSDISVAAGETIKLPAPEKDGFIFAGWYTSDKEQYTSTTMPASGLKLKAGWYKEKTDKIIVKQDSNNKDDWAYGRAPQNGTTGPKADWGYTVDLSDRIPKSGATIAVTIHFDTKIVEAGAIFDAGLYAYDAATISDSNYLTKFIQNNVTTIWQTYTAKSAFKMRNNILYLYLYAKRGNNPSVSYYQYVYYKNIWMEVAYPDTTNLYL